MTWVFWVVAAGLLLWAELHTQALYSIFMAIGAVAGAVAAGLGASLLVDCVAFAGVSALGLVLVRPVAVRRFQTPALRLPGVHGGLVGEVAFSVDSIGDENHLGHVLFAGEHWLAFTDSPAPIGAEQKVTIVGVQGTKLLVRAIS